VNQYGHVFFCCNFMSHKIKTRGLAA
jgi:hypothetical protein